MGFLAVFQLEQVAEIGSGTEYNRGILAETGKLPVVQSDQCRWNNCRAGIVDDLSCSAVARTQLPILVTGTLREQHDFLVEKEVIQLAAGPDVPFAFDRKSSP